jgi:hypothetical protein
MTERALPLGTPAPRRPEAAPAPALRSLPAAAATTRVLPRVATATRRPIHVAVTVGVTASLYAVSLAGVTVLQHDSDARLAADRGPASAAVDALRSANDAADADLAGLVSGYAGASAAYRAIADRIGAHESALAALGQRVATAEGSAASLHVPTISLAPTGTRTQTVARGSTASPGSTVSRAPTVSSLPTLSAAPVAAPRPVVNACTTASGKPC